MASVDTISLMRMAGNVFNTTSINGSGIGLGSIFTAPKTGNISKVIWRTGANTGLPVATLRVGIEGLTATRSPDATYKAAGGAYLDVVAPAASTWFASTLGSAAAVTYGDLLAATIRVQATTLLNGSNLYTVQRSISVGGQAVSSIPSATTLSGGTWAATTSGAPAVAIEYDDGTVFIGHAYTATNTTWNSGSSPLFRGNKYTPTVQCTFNQIAHKFRGAAGGNYNVEVYADTSSSPTLSVPITFNSIDVGQDGFWLIDVPQTTMSVGSVYYFVIKPTTATTNNTFIKMTYYSTAAQAAMGGANMVAATASTAGTWTATSGDLYTIAPVINDVTTSSGGGAYVIGG